MSSSRWKAFTAGMAVGAATGLLGVGVAVAMGRRRRQAPRVARPEVQEVSEAVPEADDRELDEELAQTFPASDPLPHSHLID